MNSWSSPDAQAKLIPAARTRPSVTAVDFFIMLPFPGLSPWPDSNRRGRLCRPLPGLSVTGAMVGDRGQLGPWAASQPAALTLILTRLSRPTRLLVSPFVEDRGHLLRFD